MYRTTPTVFSTPPLSLRFLLALGQCVGRCRAAAIFNRPAGPDHPPGVAFFGKWWLIVMLLVVAQDYGNAWYWGKVFYWSECLLFNSYWLWFLPLTLLWLKSPFLTRLSENIGVPRWWALIATAAVLSTVHLTLYAFWIDWASSLWLDFHFQFSLLWPKFFSQDFYQGVVVYGLIGGMFRYRNVPRSVVAPEQVEQRLAPCATLTVRIGTKEVRVPTASIDWLAKDGAYVRLHCGSKKYLRRTTLQKIAGELDGGPFLRIHRSAIVNTERVQAFRSRQNGDYDLVLCDGTVLRLSRRYREKVLVRLRRADRPASSSPGHTA